MAAPVIARGRIGVPGSRALGGEAGLTSRDMTDVPSTQPLEMFADAGSQIGGAR